ncbi:hypothetical protein JZ751_028779 [Albula glossodonta]|uniref:Uncharacterized protein n=1 Tax=Albula glossodonta TaxID=121402 RepID=A0A8T2NAL2_9TELE|nr:hypothetical protein JZ751_028779 [Albula glossodonta]
MLEGTERQTALPQSHNSNPHPLAWIAETEGVRTRKPCETRTTRNQKPRPIQPSDSEEAETCPRKQQLPQRPSPQSQPPALCTKPSQREEPKDRHSLSQGLP